MKLAPLALCVLLFSCASQPSSTEEKPLLAPVTMAAFSHLGAEFTVDVISRSIIRPEEQSLDVTKWDVDAAFRDKLLEEAKAQGRETRALSLDAAALQKALSTRESRWRKFVGRYNQALVDYLLTQAAGQGVSHLFVLSPLESRDTFPLHKGNMGIYCYDRKILKSRAYAYFFLDLTLWDVKAKKKVFQRTVDPAASQDMTFAECREVAELKEPLEALREPVDHTIGLLVKKLYAQAAAKLAN